jgi:hypothetical protein
VVVRERAPRVEREPVRAREQRIDVEAVRRDDRNRDDEEDDEPGDRKAEQARRRRVEPRAPRYEAFTSSQSFA